MALVHDLAESMVGDITPHDGVTKEDKYHRELVSGPVYVCIATLSCHAVVLWITESNGAHQDLGAK